MKAGHAVRFFEGDLVTHFQAEEEVLFPAMLDISGTTAIIGELLAEHNKLRALIDQLHQTKTSSLAATLREFADTLEAHIRKEERELFPIYEQQAPAEIISRVEPAIVGLIGHASQPHDPSC